LIKIGKEKKEGNIIWGKRETVDNFPRTYMTLSFSFLSYHFSSLLPLIKHGREEKWRKIREER